MTRDATRFTQLSERVSRGRAFFAWPLLAAVLFAMPSSCASNPATSAAGGGAGNAAAAGLGGSGVAAGNAAGAANTAGVLASAGGAASAGSAGSAGTAGQQGLGGALGVGGSASGGAPVGTAGSQPQAGRENGVDNGDLFGPGAAVPLAGSGGTGTSMGGSGGSAGSGPLGDGNFATAHFTGTIVGTATFTQHGNDVILVVSLTTCASGSRRLFIGSGDSCDSASTQGNIWDGKRGDGVNGSMLITCANNVGAFTVTRLGSDAATKWTVADHNFATDVTTHPLLLSDPTDISKNRVCASFF